MKYLPFDARCVFVDGPVAVFIHEAPESVILDAYANLRAVIEVAAQQLHKEDENATPAQPRAPTTPDRASVLSTDRSPDQGRNA
jgi:hypothetical protein